MAWQYVQTMTVAGTDVEVTRGYIISYPIDWYQQIIDNGPLPVVAFLHAGGGTASSTMIDTFKIDTWWTGIGPPASPRPLVKAIAFAPQGLGMEGIGGSWNAGNVQETNKLIGVTDVQFFFDALDQLEAILIAGYANEIQPVTSGLDITVVFDRARLMLVGFSNGGQLAYRLAVEALTYGWTVTALCVFGSSIGGWRRETDHLAGDPPEVDWTPTTDVPSLLHVHGLLDLTFQPIMDGPSDDTSDLVGDQGIASPNDFSRADISGENSAASYAQAATDLGWTNPGSGSPPTLIPPAERPDITATVVDFDSTGAGVADVQVCFILVDTLTHTVPDWAPPVVVEFLQTWGGL